MYALNAVTGQLKWTFPTTPAKVDSTAAMSNSGILYFVSRNSNARTVYAIDPAPLNAKTNPTPQDFQNAVQWTYGPTIAAQSTEGGFPIIGADGIVYVGDGQRRLRAPAEQRTAALEVPDAERDHFRTSAWAARSCSSPPPAIRIAATRRRQTRAGRRSCTSAPWITTSTPSRAPGPVLPITSRPTLSLRSPRANRFRQERT